MLLLSLLDVQVEVYFLHSQLIQEFLMITCDGELIVIYGYSLTYVYVNKLVVSWYVYEYY